jgi:hypothetical protein
MTAAAHIPSPVAAASPVPTATATVEARPSTLADPMPIAFGLFAFALAVFAVRFVTVDTATVAAGSTTEGLNYAVLVAGIGEVLASVLGIVRGLRYPAYLTGMFGLWLIGLYLLVTVGADSKEFTPNAVAWYAILLAIPVAIMAVPAIVDRNIPLIIAFIALIGVLLTLGFGFHSAYNSIGAAAASKTAPDFGTAVNLLKTSAWFAFVAAAAIWWVFAVEVYLLTGVLKRK